MPIVIIGLQSCALVCIGEYTSYGLVLPGCYDKVNSSSLCIQHNIAQHCLFRSNLLSIPTDVLKFEGRNCVSASANLSAGPIVGTIMKQRWTASAVFQKYKACAALCAHQQNPQMSLLRPQRLQFLQERLCGERLVQEILHAHLQGAVPHVR